jgi:hypothetical protein
MAVDVVVFFTFNPSGVAMQWRGIIYCSAPARP